MFLKIIYYFLFITKFWKTLFTKMASFKVSNLRRMNLCCPMSCCLDVTTTSFPILVDPMKSFVENTLFPNMCLSSTHPFTYTSLLFIKQASFCTNIPFLLLLYVFCENKSHVLESTNPVLFPHISPSLSSNNEYIGTLVGRSFTRFPVVIFSILW